jgi:hypothetical protein
VLASGTQVRVFKPGRSRQIFKGGKILSTPSFGREVKPWVPCRRFAACKRAQVYHGSRHLGKIYRSLFFAHKFQLPPSVVAGSSGGQSWNAHIGQYNKPAGCSTSVACHGRPTNKQTLREKNSAIFTVTATCLYFGRWGLTEEA